MSPPGKKIGCTTCESVVRTSQRSPTRIAAPSSIAAGPIPSKGSSVNPLRNTSSISARIALPPAPCLSVTRSSATSRLFTR